MSRPVHFWTLEDVSAVADWDPDRDPGFFGDGRGHTLYELYVRLKKRGATVSLGSHAPREARLVVTSVGELTQWTGQLLPGRVRRLATQVMPDRGALIIRGDQPLSVPVPSFARCEIMPNPSSVTDPLIQRWVVLLPQRGIVVRDPNRRGLLENMAFKGHPPNVPSFARDPDFNRSLSDVGVMLRVDTAPSAWPDFSTIDLALCMRRQDDEQEDERWPQKPPTKLINAWVAGSIPLIAPEQGYLDLARVGEDAIVVETPADVVQAVSMLRRSPELVARLEEAVKARGSEYAVDIVLDQWEELLQAEILSSPYRLGVVWTKSCLASLGRRLTPWRSY